MADLEDAKTGRRGASRAVAILLLILGFVGGCAYGDWRGESREVVRLLLRGDELSAHGAAKVTFKSDNLGYAQICEGACDVVSFNVPASAGEDAFDLRVLNADGGCVLCRNGIYLGGGPTGQHQAGGERRLELLRDGEPLPPS